MIRRKARRVETKTRSKTSATIRRVRTPAGNVGADKAGLSKPFLSLIFALLSNCCKAERLCRAAKSPGCAA
jgi:hypothetical protein